MTYVGLCLVAWAIYYGAERIAEAIRGDWDDTDDDE